MGKQPIKIYTGRITGAAAYFANQSPLNVDPEPIQKEPEPVPTKKPEEKKSASKPKDKTKQEKGYSKNGVKLGRPPKPTNKSENYQLSCTPEFRKFMKKYADKKGMSVSEFIRYCVEYTVDKQHI